MDRTPTPEQIKKVAEALSDALYNDWEELANFVQASLEAQYEDNYECFLEDWAAYVEMVDPDADAPPLDED